MVLSCWQLKITVSILLLGSSLGQEVFRACENQSCYERFFRQDLKLWHNSHSENLEAKQSVPQNIYQNHRVGSEIDEHRIDDEERRNHHVSRAVEDRTKRRVAGHLDDGTDEQFRIQGRLERRENLLKRYIERSSKGNREESRQFLEHLANNRIESDLRMRLKGNGAERHQSIRKLDARDHERVLKREKEFIRFFNDNEFRQLKKSGEILERIEDRETQSPYSRRSRGFDERRINNEEANRERSEIPRQLVEQEVQREVKKRLELEQREWNINLNQFDLPDENERRRNVEIRFNIDYQPKNLLERRDEINERMTQENINRRSSFREIRRSDGNDFDFLNRGESVHRPHETRHERKEHFANSRRFENREVQRDMKVKSEGKYKNRETNRQPEDTLRLQEVPPMNYESMYRKENTEEHALSNEIRNSLRNSRQRYDESEKERAQISRHGNDAREIETHLSRHSRYHRESERITKPLSQTEQNRQERRNENDQDGAKYYKISVRVEVRDMRNNFSRRSDVNHESQRANERLSQKKKESIQQPHAESSRNVLKRLTTSRLFENRKVQVNSNIRSEEEHRRIRRQSDDRDVTRHLDDTPPSRRLDKRFSRNEHKSTVHTPEHVNQRSETSNDRKAQRDSNEYSEVNHAEYLGRYYQNMRQVDERKIDRLTRIDRNTQRINELKFERTRESIQGRYNAERALKDRYNQYEAHESPIDKRLKEYNSSRRVDSISEENLTEKTTVYLKHNCFILGRGAILAYIVMKTLNWKNDLKNPLSLALREAFGIIGF